MVNRRKRFVTELSLELVMLCVLLALVAVVTLTLLEDLLA